MPATITGQPHDSGLYVWLQDAIRTRYGEALIAESVQYGVARYTWLLGSLKELPDGALLVEEFHEKRLRLNAWMRQRDRFRLAQNLHDRLAEQPLPANADHLAKRLARAEKEIAKAQKRWQFQPDEFSTQG